MRSRPLRLLPVREQSCKRMRRRGRYVNGSYVAKGIDRFATGKYAAGHEWGSCWGMWGLREARNVDHSITV